MLDHSFRGLLATRKLADNFRMRRENKAARRRTLG
jgi:hypothetical protein